MVSIVPMSTDLVRLRMTFNPEEAIPILHCTDNTEEKKLFGFL